MQKKGAIGIKHSVHISRKKILSQIIIGNIVIAISAIAVIALMATYTSTQHINKEFINGNKAQMEYNVAQIENELERIVRIPFSINQQIKNIQQMFDLSYRGDLLELSFKFSDFTGLFTGYNNVDSIWIYDGRSTVIDTKTGIKNVRNFDDWKIMTELREQAASNYTYLKPYISEPNTISNYHNVISIVMPLNLSGSTYNSGCAIINMDMPNVIDSVSGTGKGSFFIINTKNATEIAVRNRNLFSGDDIRRIMDFKDSGNLDLNGEKYHICIKGSGIAPNYMYVLAVPYGIMSGERRGIYLQFCFAAICLIFLEVIIIVVISTYIYHPFKTMFSNFNLFFAKEAENKPKGTFDELAVINDYMSDLQEKLNSKSEKLVEYSSLIRQNVGQKIIDGDWDNEDEIRKNLEESGVVFMSDSYTICIFMIDNWQEIAKRDKEEISAVKNAFNEATESILFSEFNCICTIPQNDRVTFIIESGNDVESRIDKAFNMVNDIFYMQVNETLSIARIPDISPITEISRSYTSLLELAQDRFNCGEKANIKKAVDKIDRKEAQKRYQTFMKNIRKTISDADADGSYAAIDSFSDSLKQMSPDCVKAIILNFAYSIKNEYRATEAADYIQNNIADIVKYSTADYLTERLKEIVGDIISSVMESSNDNITSKIKDYIDNNLKEDLSLVVLGDKFRLTPSYLSTLFKSTQGIGVVDYINKSRIEKAKYLLRNSDMSIKDISDETGFLNYNSFARVFKKYAGVSAKSYKQETDNPTDISE